MKYLRTMFIVFVVLASTGINVNAQYGKGQDRTPDFGALASTGYFEFAECSKYSSAGDDFGLNKMLSSGQCFRLEPGIRVLFLECSHDKRMCQFRVMEGSHKNQAVWLNGELLFYAASLNETKEGRETKRKIERAAQKRVNEQLKKNEELKNVKTKP